ncbi:MAG TPA: glutamine synthetase III [Clostridia bacterium]|nr:glutamine synthetase III [Clostridia bacterium]
MTNMPGIFGINVFSDKVMRKRLPQDTYKKLKRTIENGRDLDVDVANAVAIAMKDWAVEKGATHFTHWFQPMTGITAEKHDSFITPSGEGEIIMEFSGSSLIKGEPDASSFPSGGLRATFEARGYTAWDPTSYAFIKDGVLCIPTVFCSYSGEILDKKTPLLRSMQVMNKQVLRILRLFGKTHVENITTTVGAEQEYFLIDKDVYNKRRDLVLCGRTLFGARPPKGQELEDHYFGAIKPRVHAFMKELDEELWKLGVMAKTEHNESAPSQHELAPIYSTTNIACDHNHLTMEFMKKVADRHHLTCLLHEKPFAGLNGSGKHNNWSMSTDTGKNLFEPGKSPEDNAQFLLFLVAVIKAVDENADMLRISVASAGNDHRLGSNEAPPAIVSIFLGNELTAILESIEKGTPYDRKANEVIKIGASVLPPLPKDATDRNRTSPFAFTGDKFEFRMLGSSMSVAGPNIVMNTAVADVLSCFADKLEKAEDFNAAITELIRETVKNHKRIIFNGNSYSEDWVKEAESRGLLNIQSTADALPYYKSAKNIALFSKHKVFTKAEVESRCKLLLENYTKVLTIEAQTMLSMVKRDILPAAVAYSSELAESALRKKAVSNAISTEYETTLAAKLSQLCECLYNDILALEAALLKADDYTNAEKCAKYFSSVVLAKMCLVRQVTDELETLVAAKYWPYPIYSDILFSV